MSVRQNLTGLDRALWVICALLFGTFVVGPFLIPKPIFDEGWGELMGLAYLLVLTPVSAILVFLDSWTRKRRATALFWVPLVLFFCVLALPAYMFARRDHENKSTRLQT